MPRPTKEAYYLSDAEKRDLIQLIQQGKPLPEQYRFILFEDKCEVELVWNGKSREVCTTVLPFQSLEHVDEPRREAPESPQLDLFDFRGRQLKPHAGGFELSFASFLDEAPDVVAFAKNYLAVGFKIDYVEGRR